MSAPGKSGLAGLAMPTSVPSLSSLPGPDFARLHTQGKEIMAHVRTVSRVYLLLRILGTVATLTWAIVYTRSLWHSKFDKDKRDRLTAINDLWLGSQSGVLFTLIAHWAFTIALMVLSPLLGTVLAAVVEYLRVD